MVISSTPFPGQIPAHLPGREQSGVGTGERRPIDRQTSESHTAHRRSTDRPSGGTALTRVTQPISVTAPAGYTLAAYHQVIKGQFVDIWV